MSGHGRGNPLNGHSQNWKVSFFVTWYAVKIFIWYFFQESHGLLLLTLAQGRVNYNLSILFRRSVLGLAEICYLLSCSCNNVYKLPLPVCALVSNIKRIYCYSSSYLLHLYISLQEVTELI